ncbi:MAG TPA: DUF5916 domain-containing protein [Vicinamibacterales bacterium]|jgi:hypothetical protein|nr:DUF5916 domain-containing protein [Vicinamibacterales bacterium]
MSVRLFSYLVAASAVLALAVPAFAQSSPEGPEPPVAPATVSRDDEGRVALRAVRLEAPIKVDGHLDEAVYATVPSVSQLWQQEPVEGDAATEKTEFWVFFDGDRLYVSVRAWETHMAGLVANEMRRDNNNIFQNDHVAFLLDTFHDRRNGVEFAINAIGGRWDGQISNETQFNADWNPVYDIAVGRFDGGWTIEVAIPFKSLRYGPGRAQVWGMNVRRVNRAKNETSFLTHVPRALGQRGLFHASLAATLTGLEVPPGSRIFEVKPYLVSSLTSDTAATPRISNDLTRDFGVDAKVGVTQGLTADLTYNTDFAQVEADEQQVNLTRFSLFFPEKRDFFLENLGLFGFGGVAATGGGDVPILFHSRRIGFDAGRAVPIEAGGRLTGRAGRFSIGLLDIESDREPASGAPRTNFSVLRVKRDLLRRSSVGMIFTGRDHVPDAGQGSAASNETYGVDGTFAFFDNLAINTFWARTHTDGVSGDDASYRAQLDYAGDRYGVQVEHMAVGDNFRPEIGYVRRDNVRRSLGMFRFSPRPRASRLVRKYSYAGTLVYTETGDGHLDTRDWRGELGIEFQNSDKLTASYGGSFERLPQPLRVVGLTIPAGGYDYATARIGFAFGQQRHASGSVTVERGQFYNGDKTTLTISQGRLNLSSQLSVEPTYLGNWVTLPDSRSTTHLAGTRVTYTMTPTMFASALVQYNTGVHAVSANVRLRWEYRPGSELFVVFNEQRDTETAKFPDLLNRAVIVKVNRLLRF